MADTLPKVFQVGFNKCATRSLTELFARSGHLAAHHKFKPRFGRNRNIAELVRTNVATGRKMFAGFDQYVFYADLMIQTRSETYEVYKDFRRVLEDYPGTILLLNYRDREDWIRSRLKHGHGTFCEMVMEANGFSTRDECADFWRADWDAHLADVRAAMVDRPEQLVEYNIDTQTVDDLVAALPAYKLNPTALDDIGRTRGRNRGRIRQFLSRKNAERRMRD